MKFKKGFCAIISVAIMLTFFCVPISADESTNTYNVSDCGVTIDIPSNFSVLWDGLSDDDPVLGNFNFTSVEQLYSTYMNQFHLYLDAYDFAERSDHGGNIHVAMFDTGAASIEDDTLKRDFEASFNNQFQTSLGNNVTYSYQEINGVDYLNAQYFVQGNGFTVTGNHYIAVKTDGKAVDICALTLQSDKQDEYVATVNKYISDAMKSVHIDDTVKADNMDNIKVIYTLPDNISFSMPAEWYGVWNDMPEDSPSIEALGFDNKTDLIQETLVGGSLDFFSRIPSKSYDFYIKHYENTDDLSEITELTGASDADKEKLKQNYIDTTRSDSGDPDACNDLEYETTEINGYEFEHFTYSVKLSDTTRLNDAYISIIDGNVISVCGSCYNGQFSESDKEDLTSSVSNIMSGMTITGSESSAAVQEAKEPTLLDKFGEIDFPLWIVIIALVIVLFIGSSLSRKGEWQEEPLSLDKSKCVQGFCAVAIILHHLSQRLANNGDAGALSMFTNIGVIFVGIFFFFSGYGLFKSLKTKKDYLKGFFKKRLPTILVPFYMCILIFTVCAFITGRQFDIGSIIATITGWSLINTHMWYIVEIAVLYVIFYFVFRFIKKENVAIAVMGVLTAGVTVFSLLLGHGENFSCRYWFMGEWWFNTTLLFFVGILIARNESFLLNFAKKTYRFALPLCIIITGVLYYFTQYALNNFSYYAESAESMGYPQKFICLGFQLPMAIFAVISVLLIMMKIKFSNPVLKFLGTIALELYLIHNLFLEGLANNNIGNLSGSGIYVVLTVLLSIALAAVIHGIDKYIISLITRKQTAAIIETKRIHSIDCMRYIMAFFVVCIHIPFESAAGNVAVAFGKIAVPFFLVVCGYFLYRNDNNEFFARLKKQTIRVLAITIGANILFIAYSAISSFVKYGNLNSFTGNFTGNNIVDFLLYNMSPFGGHLWYLGSLLYALVILMILCKTKIHKYVMFASPVLLGVYIALTWFGHAEYFVYRNALLVTLPYVMMGCLIRRYEDKLMKIKSPVLFGLLLVLCVTNVIELNVYSRGTGVPFFSAEILVYVVVLLMLKFRDFGKGTLMEKLGSKCSLFIYIVHMLVILLISDFVPDHTGFLTTYGPVTVFIVTTLIAVLFKIKDFIPKKPDPADEIKEQPEKVLEKIS